MRYLILILGGLVALSSSCLTNQQVARRANSQQHLAALTIHTARFELFDSSRQRVIPVVAYFAGARNVPAPGLKLALLNHGYGMRNTAYSFMARSLAAHGYFVASLQQTLPQDQPIPATGDLYQTRYPYWERGVQNMVFALRALKRRYPTLHNDQNLLVGHSFGGDMVMLFAKEHPELVQKVISLDNCRMPFPRTRQPVLYSLRSSDQVPDPGVLPTPTEQAQFGVTVIKLPATTHNAMCDKANDQQKQEMTKWIAQFVEAP
jgi:predicted dienelactone hydrolase